MERGHRGEGGEGPDMVHWRSPTSREPAPPDRTRLADDYAVAAYYSRKRRKKPLNDIVLHDDHAVEVLGLLPPLAYFVLVWAKGNLSLIDAAVLTATYAIYLWVLIKLPPREEMIEEVQEIPRVSRWALSPPCRRWAASSASFSPVAVIYFVAEPFLPSCSRWRRAVHVASLHPVVAPFLRMSRKTSAFAGAPDHPGARR